MGRALSGKRVAGEGGNLKMQVGTRAKPTPGSAALS